MKKLEEIFQSEGKAVDELLDIAKVSCCRKHEMTLQKKKENMK